MQEKSNSYQRVRSPQKVLEEKAANCLDISILFASLFERAGLYPVIALLSTHAMPGIIIASSEHLPNLDLPEEPSSEIYERFEDNIVEVRSEDAGLEKGSILYVLIFEGTLARRQCGDKHLVCDLDFTASRAVVALKEDSEYRKSNHMERIRFCNI